MNRIPQRTIKSINTGSSERLIGSVNGSAEGPTVIALAGMHGNEVAGVEALKYVFKELETVHPDFSGAFWGVRANQSALRRGVRFVDEDMNRIWFPSILEDVRHKPAGELPTCERREVKAVLKLLERLIPAQTEHPIIIVDLHSFSAEGCMFIITANRQRNVQLLSQLHAPMIFGIENSLRGTALRYYQDQGYLTFAFEGGQHRNRLTVYNIVAGLFVLLNEVGCIEACSVPKMSEYRNHLKEHTQHVPARVELVYQHIREPGDGFSMRPGFCNFDPITKGEWLASDREGKIRAEYDGFILMPLYQNQGNDGFFIVRKQHS